jgi:tol-pal system protein YbgF
MRLFICFVSFLLFNSAFAEEAAENKVPVYEPITQDIGGRLDRVEKILNNKALLDMLEVLESLKTEVSTLRGEIEVQTHTIDQLKQKQRDLYTDIDKRLQRLESNATSTTTRTEQTDSANLETTKTDAVVADTDKPAEKEPADPAKAEAVYQRAFKLLKESQYDQAHTAFKAFLKDYPDSSFSDNAQYWIGEANYVMQKYELAINEYQALLNTYPESQKVSHALLKIGYSYAELGNASDAKKTLNDVKSKYPGTTAARLADERLRKIGSAKETNS